MGVHIEDGDPQRPQVARVRLNHATESLRTGVSRAVAQADAIASFGAVLDCEAADEHSSWTDRTAGRVRWRTFAAMRSDLEV